MVRQQPATLCLPAGLPHMRRLEWQHRKWKLHASSIHKPKHSYMISSAEAQSCATTCFAKDWLDNIQNGI